MIVGLISPGQSKNKGSAVDSIMHFTWQCMAVIAHQYTECDSQGRDPDWPHPQGYDVLRHLPDAVYPLQ
jgi:hypothetical protein